MGKTNNLLGESFSDFVTKQINHRQSTLGKFTSRTNSDIQYYTSKTSWIQLTSGVNITAIKANSLNLPSEYAGSKLAENFILQGGANSGTNKRGGILANYNDSFLSNTSYGFASTSEFGLSPIPGLIDAEVKTLNRGSLKEASVKIKCFNKYQFDIIDTLFLKLKYPVLLEWGHSIYLDENGDSQTDIDTLSQLFLGKDGNVGPNPTQNDIYKAIDKNRDKYCGNYDATLQYV